MAKEFSNVFVFAGAYDDTEDAKSDFAGIKFLHDEGWIGKYQAAIFEKVEEGKVKVLDTTSTTRTAGAKWGAGLGAVFGLLFPPSILVSAGLGALAGAGVGTLSKGWLGGDVKQVADTLEPGQAGVIVFAEATPEVGYEKLLKKAVKAAKQQVDADAADIKRALDEEVADIG